MSVKNLPVPGAVLEDSFSTFIPPPLKGGGKWKKSDCGEIGCKRGY